MEKDLIDHVSEDATNNLCNDECRNRNVDGWFIDPCRLDNMVAIIMVDGRLQVNVIHSHKVHGKFIIRFHKFLLGLDVEILETDAIHREEHFFRLVERNMNQLSFLVLMMLLYLECPRLGLVEYNRSLHKSILHRKLIVGIDVNDNPIVR